MTISIVFYFIGTQLDILANGVVSSPDTLYSNFVAWLSHCPLAWHRIAPCMHPALCVLKRTVALEGLRCAFVRIVPT